MEPDPPSVQQMLGEPSDVPFDGKVYKLGPPNQRAKAILEELVAQHTVEAITKLKGVLPPGQYRELFDSLTGKLAANKHATGGELWGETLSTAGGSILFTLSLFRVNHSTMTVAECETVAAGADDVLAAALVRQVPGFFDVAFPNLPPEVRKAQAAVMAAEMEKARRRSSDASPPSGTAS